MQLLPYGYIMDRRPVKEVVASNLEIFDKCISSIVHESQLHNADFKLLRLQYILAKLKTYIGLARISEYSISQNQWLEWFKTEIYQTLEEAELILKFTGEDSILVTDLRNKSQNQCFNSF
jgi:hypothetical protein